MVIQWEPQLMVVIEHELVVCGYCKFVVGGSGLTMIMEQLT